MDESALPLPEVLKNGIALRERIVAARREGKRVGLVPTMGALHEGHLSLVRAARSENDLVVVTIFVNPTQFAPGEDLDRYPRDLENDRRLLATAGANLVFAPTVEEMYPKGSDTSVDVGAAAKPLEGAARPTHFRGVATVVLKLFNLAPANRAYFGRKDYQQTVVLRQMVRDLNVPIELRVRPLVRDADGLALSSRNARLTEEERRRALAIPRCLQEVERLAAGGETDCESLRTAAEQVLAAADLRADYVAFLRDGTLAPVDRVEEPTAVVVAARVGQTRLLDNTQIG